jgi:hypothetical protein
MFGERRAERKKRKEEMEALRKSVLAESGQHRTSVEAKKAIAYCEYCIREYEDLFEYNEWRWFFWQRVVVVGGVVATIVGTISLPNTWTSGWEAFGWLRGVPAALATIAGGLLSSFTYREDAVRHEMTANSLWNELARFQVRAEPYNGTEPKDTSAFMNAVCRMVESELSSWSALVGGARAEADKKSSSARSTIASPRKAKP